MRKSIENSKAKRGKFAGLLKTARMTMQHRLTQKQLAERVGIERTSISQYEHGKDEHGKVFPPPLTLVKLANALGIDYKEWIQVLECDPKNYENLKGDINYLSPNYILTEDDLDFLKRQQKAFDPFTLRFALELLARRKITKSA